MASVSNVAGTNGCYVGKSFTRKEPTGQYLLRLDKAEFSGMLASAGIIEDKLRRRVRPGERRRRGAHSHLRV